MYKLCFYIPSTHLESVKDAIFSAGAGRIGGYDRCAWQSLGQGQFRPLVGSQPYSGQIDAVSMVEEYKVETLCADDCIDAAIKALKATHPYEVPAYDVWQTENK